MLKEVATLLHRYATVLADLAMRYPVFQTFICTDLATCHDGSLLCSSAFKRTSARCLSVTLAPRDGTQSPVRSQLWMYAVLLLPMIKEILSSVRLVSLDHADGFLRAQSCKICRHLSRGDSQLRVQFNPRVLTNSGDSCRLLLVCHRLQVSKCLPNRPASVPLTQQPARLPG